MSYLIYKGLNESQQQFIVENASDVANLPTTSSVGNASSAYGIGAENKVGPGSIALCVDTGDLYVLSTNDIWTKVGG